MTTINTKLVKDGNSVAIRLPKTVLAMSGLLEDVQMEVKHGQITLRSVHNARSGWKEQIAQTVISNPKAIQLDDEFNDWDLTTNDGLS